MARQSGSPKSWYFLVVLLIGAGGLLGCASSDSGTMVTENADITYTMAPNTIVVTADDAAGVDFVDLETGDIFLRSNSTVGSSVEVGKVLAFSITDETPNGLLRKVTAVNQIDAGLTMVETEQATLLEAFDELDLTLEQPLHFEGLANYQSALNGVAIQQSALAVSGSISKDFEINFDQTVLFDLDGDKSTTYDRVVADGEIQFSLGLALEVKTNYLSLKRLKVGVAVEEDSNLVVHTTLPSLNFEKEIVVAELFFPPISIGPVVVTVTLELVLGANGELKAQVSSSVTHSMQASVGTVLQNGSWSPYSDYSSEWNFQPPTLSASARLKAYLGPRVNLMIYGAAGPYAMATGYLELAADISKTPWWQLFVGLEAFVGIRGEILGIELMDFRSGDLLDFRKVLAEAKQGVECVPDCSGRECGPDPVCGESCGTCTGGETCNSSGQCVSETCVPDCSGRECGPDPVCGESCGTCAGGETCNSSGQCISEECEPDCSGRECGPDPVCGESCGTCTGEMTCSNQGDCFLEDCSEGWMVTTEQPDRCTPIVSRVATSGLGSCAVAIDGSIYCWGRFPGTDSAQLKPQKVLNIPEPVRDVAMSDSHACAVTASGVVYCWGRNNYGQLGDGTLTDRSTPAKIHGLSVGVESITLGWGNTCIVTDDGAVYCWGDGSYGKLGNGDTANQPLPVEVTGLQSGYLDVACGHSSCCALGDDGSVVCWGDNALGVLGDGTITDRKTPVSVVGLTDEVVQVQGCHLNFCVLYRSGQVACWGNNDSNSLGNPDLKDRCDVLDFRACSRSPVLVQGLNSTVSRIAVGPTHSCALLQNGVVECWGGNLSGQLGRGSTGKFGETGPIAQNPGSVSDIECGKGSDYNSGRTCAVWPEGVVRCWGYNGAGQIGDGTRENALVPTGLMW